MRKLIIICLLLASPIVNAQAIVDSVKLSLQAKPKLTFNLSSRNAVITNEFAKMRSVFVGANYADRTRLGLSFNWLALGYQREYPIINQDTITDLVNRDLRMFYIAPHAEYMFYKTAHWEMTIPVQLGLGYSYFKHEYNNETFTQDGGLVALYEPAMTVTYRFLKYFGVGGGIGVRLMLKNNRNINERFTAPFYMYWFKIYFGDVFNDYVKNVID